LAAAALSLLAAAAALLLPAAAAAAMVFVSRRLIGGQTGDVGGATQQLAEIAALIGVLLAMRP
jgi:adenosylcobinamide-GDP ribazoletransferase